MKLLIFEVPAEMCSRVLTRDFLSVVYNLSKSGLYHEWWVTSVSRTCCSSCDRIHVTSVPCYTFNNTPISFYHMVNACWIVAGEFLYTLINGCRYFDKMFAPSYCSIHTPHHLSSSSSHYVMVFNHDNDITKPPVDNAA